jgi:mitochondrial fission protein ELM1
MVISCGSSLAAVNLVIKRETGAKSVVIMKPPYPSKRFDLVIAPKHDKIRPLKNVFVTRTSPSLITEEYLKKFSEPFLKMLSGVNGSRRIGFLVGGDTDKVKFSKEYFKRFVGSLEKYSVDSGSVVLATSSRRTPEWADEVLKTAFKGNQNCPLLVIANESNPPGVVGGILGLSDLIVVSGESMSMVSEAVSSGKPVLVFMPSAGARMKSKHRDFLKQLEDEKLIVLADPSNVGEILKSSAEKKDPSLSLVLKDRETLCQAVKRVAS